MTFQEIFEAYYALYRTQAETPATTDDEYTVAIQLANEAIRRWSKYDNTLWKELFQTNLLSENAGDQSVSLDVAEYEAPSDMQSAGGFIQIKDGDTTVRRYPIIEPHEAQFMSDAGMYAYFIGDPNNGFTLTLNPAADSAIDGLDLDYIYYKKPTLMENEDSIPEMAEPYFMVHRMLANRFRGSRNPYYGTAKTDAEDALRTMQLANNSGSWANPWSVTDTSGTSFGS